MAKAKKAKYPHLLGSKWTAMRRTWGWRHFQVVNRKNEGGFVFAEMTASCDRETRFWINAKVLKDRNQWRPGWKSLAEQSELGPDPEWGEVILPEEAPNEFLGTATTVNLKDIAPESVR